MGFTTKREGFVKATEMLTALVNDMSSNGFDIQYLNGTASTGPANGETTSVCLAATTDVDPLAGEDEQPWSIFLEAHTQQGMSGENISYKFNDGHQNWLRIWVCTPNQIIENPDGTWRIAHKSYRDDTLKGGKSTTRTVEVKGSGFLGIDSLIKDTLSKTGSSRINRKTNGYFYCFNSQFNEEDDDTVTNVPNWGREGDFAAHPLSYRLSISDHGIAFAMWGESYDSDGSDQAWFCTQRMVDKDNGNIVVDEKSPLFTVFSLYGNGDDPASQDPNQILYMVTREKDVTAPTYPRSAVVDSADSTRIINNKEQIAIGEDEKFIVHLPNGLSTQRYGYPHELDMIGYTSADAVSHDNSIDLTFYGEAQDRNYKGLGANASFNRGVRIIMQVGGIGIDITR